MLNRVSIRRGPRLAVLSSVHEFSGSAHLRYRPVPTRRGRGADSGTRNHSRATAQRVARDWHGYGRRCPRQSGAREARREAGRDAG